MKVVFIALSSLWLFLSFAKLILIFEDINTLHNLDVFLRVNIGSSCISVASLTLIVLYYTNTLPSTSALVTTILTTAMTLGYLVTWLAFGTNLSLLAFKQYVDLSQLMSGLLPYVFIDCVLICTQFAMIALESLWFLTDRRSNIERLQQRHSMDTLTHTVIFLTIVTTIIQIVKVAVIGTNWPLKNDASVVLAIISAIFTLCNTVVYITINPSLEIDIVRGTAALVLLSMANLLIAASTGSSILMMELEPKDSHQMLFGLDIATLGAQFVGTVIVQYSGHNLLTSTAPKK